MEYVKTVENIQCFAEPFRYSSRSRNPGFVTRNSGAPRRGVKCGQALYACPSKIALVDRTVVKVPTWR